MYLYSTATYAPLGDLIDFFDPLGIHKIPGAVKKKVDHYVDQKVAGAANLAGKKVQAGVSHAIHDAGREALMFAAGGALIGAVWGGVALYRHHAHAKGHR